MVTGARLDFDGNRVLTRRELEVTVLASFGMTSARTAKVLGCATETVKFYRRQILLKTRAKNMTHAVATLMRQNDGQPFSQSQ
jgi:DNA-binding CsgD family transcriptional regulator